MSVYTTLPISALQNTTKYYMDDEVKNYKEGDVIYYSGKCHEFSDFYARLTRRCLEIAPNRVIAHKLSIFARICIWTGREGGFCDMMASVGIYITTTVKVNRTNLSFLRW